MIDSPIHSIIVEVESCLRHKIPVIAFCETLLVKCFKKAFNKRSLPRSSLRGTPRFVHLSICRANQRNREAPKLHNTAQLPTPTRSRSVLVLNSASPSNQASITCGRATHYSTTVAIKQ